ncbi:MAG: 4Fe-4S binding protein [Actinobacteria bacterium]|nr:4Fe-4S binding protein [Actinomycetota bacterium]
MREWKIDYKSLVKRVDADKTGDFISYDQEKCNGCGLCAAICPYKLWSVNEGKARLAPRFQELCLECASCWEICEQEAIDFSYPRGGTGVVIEYG